MATWQKKDDSKGTEENGSGEKMNEERNSDDEGRDGYSSDVGVERWREEK